MADNPLPDSGWRLVIDRCIGRGTHLKELIPGITTVDYCNACGYPSIEQYEAFIARLEEAQTSPPVRKMRDRR